MRGVASVYARCGPLTAPAPPAASRRFVSRERIHFRPCAIDQVTWRSLEGKMPIPFPHT